MTDRPTLGAAKVDREIVRSVLPETWTHVHNLNWLRIGFHLKLAGVDWRSLEEGMAKIERMGLVQRDGFNIRRTP